MTVGGCPERKDSGGDAPNEMTVGDAPNEMTVGDGPNEMTVGGCPERNDSGGCPSMTTRKDPDLDQVMRKIAKYLVDSRMGVCPSMTSDV